ncbi:MAG: RHS repeat-associated core domain-containing protein [Burkholderiaceae bacterium]
MLISASLLCLAVTSLANAQTPPANAFAYERSSAFEYHPASGLLTAETIEPDNPALCLRTEHTYDAYGNKTASTTKNCPGATGAAVFTARTTTTSYAATAANPVAGQFPTSSRNALGHMETRSFDPATGQLLSLTSPNGLSTTWQYDSLGRKIHETRADGNRTRWQYFYCGQAFGATGVVAATVTDCISAQGHTAAYRVAVQPLNSTGALNGPQQRDTFDPLGRVIRTELTSEHYPNLWRITERGYNALGLLVRTTAPVFSNNTSAVRYGTSTAYDVLGRVISQQTDDATAPGGKAVSTTSYSARTTVNTNPLGQRKVEEKDPLGRLLRVTDAQGNQVSYLYDAFDNLLRTVDPLGNTINNTYDVRGRKLSMADPDMGTWRYSYNALGELVTQTNAKRQVTTNTYDALGRIVRKVQPTQTATWSYDKYADGTACTKGTGKLCETATDTGYRRRIAYDGLSRPTRTDTWLDRPVPYSSQVTYDANGRVATQTWPTGIQVYHAYNSVGGLNKVALDTAGGNTAQTLWQFLAADARDNVTVYRHGNGVQTTRNYTADTGRPDIVWSGTGNKLVNHYYWYDAAGNVTARKDNNKNVTDTFLYDDLNRLIGHYTNAPAGNHTRSWTYNALGNILNRNAVGAYQYNASGAGSVRPHAVNKIIGTDGLFANPQYSYDANGNLTAVTSSNGRKRTHTFTSFDMPQSLTMSTPATNAPTTQAGNASASFVYDSSYGRVKESLARTVNGQVKTRTLYQLHPDQSGGLYYEREIKEDGTVEHRHFILGSIVLVSTTDNTTQSKIVSQRYWQSDPQGTTVAVSNQAGQLIEQLSHEPFGKRRNTNGFPDPSNLLRSVNNDRGYTGHEQLDELGFIHMNGRIYDPAINKFLSADPIIQASTNLQSYNRYAYVTNNPLNATDPSGFMFNGMFKVPFIDSPWNAYVKPNVPQIIALAIGFATQQWYITSGYWGGAIGAGIAGGFAGGFVGSGGNLQAGLQGGITGALFAAAGGIGKDISWSRLGAHAMAGCVSGELQDGKCGTGAISAVAGKTVTMGLDMHYGGSIPFSVGFTSAVISGGTASIITGGKFANGAVTGAFGYLYNYCSTNGCTPTESGKLRESDIYGNGQFGASRDGGKRFHMGQDFITEPGEKIFAPISGKAIRTACPYCGKGDNRLTGIVIANEEHIQSKTFYVKPFDGIIGTSVTAGQAIGTAQDLHIKYPTTMKNHVHTEILNLKNNQFQPLTNFIK